MRLTLSVLRCPPSAPPETRVFEGGEISIGRGPDNDWVLPDPERHLSKRHCMVAFHGGGWQLADLSTNGTFLNGGSDPLGQGMPRNLREGDRIRLGDYELEARIGPAQSAAAPAWSDPFGADPFAPSQPMGQPIGMQPSAESGINLPQNFDPMAPDEGDDSWLHPTQSDNSPSTHDAFRPPSVVSALPDDWADDLLPGPPAAAPRPLPPEPPPHAAPPPAPESYSPESYSPEVYVPPPFVPAPPPVAAPPPPPMAPPPAMPPSAAPLPVAPAAAPAASDSALLAAFLRGAGMPDIPVADPAELMVQAGEMLRAMVAGLRHAMIARSAVKGEFRIERTMISARGNNPLKFSADDDDAMSALIGGRRRANMLPPQAVADALRDIRLHELATMAAMQAAIRAVVARLDPVPLKQEAGTGALPMQRKARAWDAFETLHAKVTQDLADDFDSVFGKSFARAYEQAQDEISAKEGPLP